MAKNLTLEIPATWQFVRNVRRLVEEVLADQPEPVRYAAAMVATELVGNAIKYGEQTPTAPNAKFSISVSNSQVLIEVTNGLKSQERLHEVQRRVEQMTQSQNREQFYLKRLQELLSGSSHGSQLGLYRIGYEGDFNLSFSYDNQVLTVRATRGLA